MHTGIGSYPCDHCHGSGSLSVPLDTLARFIRESAPAESMRLQGANAGQGWAGGCDSACERIANAIADASDLRPSERAAFLSACGVA